MNYKLILIETQGDIKKDDIFTYRNLNELHTASVDKDDNDGLNKQLLVLVSDEEIKVNDLHYAEIYKLPMVADTNKEKRDGLYKVVSTSSKELTPNSIISLDKQKEIVEYYNENGCLPDVISGCTCDNPNCFSTTNSEIQFDICY